MAEEPREARPPETGSWLDEISWATKLVVIVTLGTIAGFGLYLIVDLFL